MIISAPTIHGSGRVSGVFQNQEGTVLAITSNFPLLTNSSGRAAYAGQALRHRLALYRRGERSPFAAIDDLRLPINHVSFHPRDPVIAVAAGCYDGGWMFKGDLVFWNWAENRSWRPITQLPEVVRCDFDVTGDQLNALVRPWDEEWGSSGVKNGVDEFHRVYPLTVAYSPMAANAAVDVIIDPTAVLALDDPSSPMDPNAAAGQMFERQLADWFRVERVVTRGAVWDIQWLTLDRVAAVHDGCLVEIFDLATDQVECMEGEGRGVAILRTTPPIVHVVQSPARRHADNPSSRLLALRDDGLVEIGSYQGTYSFASSQDGRVLGRLDRSWVGSAIEDLVIDVATGTAERLDLGHYDCFNHYIGIDGAPELFFLQGTPPKSHENKYLCILRSDGIVIRLWPLLTADGSFACHAMECSGCYVKDRIGAGVIVTGMHHDPNPSKPKRGFIYRKPIDADRELWRHETSAATSAISHIPERGLIAAAFLDSTLQLLDAVTGAVEATGRVSIDGFATVIFAMDASQDALVVGTFDGCVAVIKLDDLLALDMKFGRFELN